MESLPNSNVQSSIHRVEDSSSTSSIDKLALRKELTIPESLRILTDPRQELSALSTVIPSGLKLPQLSPDTTERVFPIRSVVSVGSSTPSSALQTPSLESSEWQISPFSDSSWGFSTGGEKSSSQPIAPASNETSCICTTAGHDDSGNAWRHNARRESVSPETLTENPHLADTFPDSLKNVSYSPIREYSNPADLQNLHQGDESLEVAHKFRAQLQEIQKEKSVYSFGVLIVLRKTEGKLVVQIASKNSEEVVGHTSEELFGLHSFDKILQQHQKKEFISHANSIRDKCYNVEQHGPDVLDLAITARNGEPSDFWCTMHATKESPDYIVCEIEPQQNSANSFCYRDDSNFHQPIHGEARVSRTLLEGDDDTLEALRVFRVLRGSKNGFEYSSTLNAMSRIIQLTTSAQSIDVLFSRVTKILKELTGFNRATVYRFDSDWNGIAVADLADPDFSGDTYENMHFLGPIFSEDLQTLHQRNKVRVSYNHTQQSPAELIYREHSSASQLDTRFCYLSMGSPAPLELLSRTPVEACVSIRINVFGKLWGLVSCKSYIKGARLLPPLQKLCWLISDTLSSNIERLSYTLPFQMIEQTSAPKETGRKDASPGVDILSLFGADYAAYSIVGETKILGKPYDSQEVLALVEYLRMRELDTLAWSTDISKDFQDLSYPSGFKYISGLLFIPLSGDGLDFIIFFRTSKWKEITWAGCSKHDSHNESKASCIPGKEDVLCRPDGWSAVDLGKASVLSLIYKTFTEVWQQKETAVQNTQLTKLLLANSAHEFRTPLNAIINYLEIALDGSLSQETRDNLSRSHSASKSLVYIINDLLDLTNAENGQSLIKDEVFDLSGTIRDATHIFGEEAKQKNVNLHVVEHTNLPLVLGDQRRVRQVIMNLISNAVQHTSDGSVIIESCLPPDMTESDTIAVEVAIHDTGSGMSQEAVEALFCQLEEVSSEDYLRNPQCCRSKTDDTNGESKDILGLGLALVARIVRNMDGRLSLKSEQGKGSCFKIKLRFPLPPDGQRPVSSQKMESEELGKGNAGGNEASTTDDLQGQPKLCGTKDETMPESTCDNECSSRYGETSENDKNASNRNVNIAMSTESSELQYQSDMNASSGQHNEESGPSIETSVPPLTPSKPTSSGPLSETLDQAVASAKEPSQKPTTTGDHENSDPKPVIEYSTNQAPTTSTNATPTPGKSTKSSLRVLVAEDDPINSTIVRKRLEKLGHTVHLTVNGKECASAYRDGQGPFDALLMDIQVGALQLLRRK